MVPKFCTRYAVATALAVAAALSLTVPPGTTSAASTDLYVSPTGVDSGSCTSTMPCQSFLYATSLATPGSTVWVQPGTYSVQQVTAIGTAAAPITVQAVGSVTLTRPAGANDATQQTALIRIVNSAYVTVQGFTLVGMRGRSDVLPAGCQSPNCDQPYGGELTVEDHCAPTPCVATTGVGIVVANNSISHSENSCVKVQNHESGVVITGNTLTDCGETYQLDHGIYVSGPNVVVSNNVISTTTGFGVTVYSNVGLDVSGALIQNNVITNATMAGVQDFSSATYTGNVITLNGQDGIDAGPNSTFTYNVFYGNDVRNTGSYSIKAWGLSNETINNNTFYLDGMAAIMNTNLPRTGPISAQANIFVGKYTTSRVNNTPAYTGDFYDYNDYVSVTLPPRGHGDRHSFSANPLFVSPPTDFHLQPGSPCLLSTAVRTQLASTAPPFVGALGV